MTKLALLIMDLAVGYQLGSQLFPATGERTFPWVIVAAVLLLLAVVLLGFRIWHSMGTHKNGRQDVDLDESRDHDERGGKRR